MPTTYTFAKKPINQLAEGVTLTHFNNQPNDGARVSIQGIGNGPMTTDASASIISSPVSVGPTLAKALTTPESAIEITLVSATPLQVSEASASMSSYFQIPPNTPQTFDIANCQTLYLLQANSTVGGASFFYTIV